MKPMNMTRRFSTSFAMLLAVTACDPAEAPLDPTPELRSAPSSSQLEDTFCTAKRQLALLPSAAGVCPTVGGWTGGKVFPGMTDGLGKFCKYDWSGGPGLPNVAALQNVGLLRVASDCGGVYDHSTDVVWSAVGPEVEEVFHHGIGRVSATDLSLSSFEDSRSRVVVAVVDTVPEPQPAQPRSLHGDFMVSLIEDLACPAGTDDCAVSVVRSLGLPRYIDGEQMDLVDTVNGGTYGTQNDMAKAIYQSVQAWKAAGGASTSKMIINLSVGWDGDIFGDVDDPTPRPAVEAVYAAIQYARCHGIAVIAAAGNQGSDCGTGPVLPAAWEQHPVPSHERCIQLGAPTLPASVGYAPLVYSVGGLTHDHEPMARTRIGAKPRLAALATNAVAGGGRRTMTGTSAAAAVASGTLALIWSYNPQLSVSAAMSLLYQTGIPTDLDANYSLPNTANTDVHAINACAALEAACNLESSDCPDVPFQDPLGCLDDEQTFTMTQLFEHLEGSVDEEVTTTVIGQVIPCASECSVPAQAFIADATVSAECPEPSSVVRPYTLPQPTEIGCPNCTLDVAFKAVYATLDPALEDREGLITDVTVSVIDGTTARTSYFVYGPLNLTVGTITKLKLNNAPMPAIVRSASISITFTDGLQTVDPLLIGP
jgi:subtilisin family serine protease